jgi:hypothetical protein
MKEERRPLLHALKGVFGVRREHLAGELLAEAAFQRNLAICAHLGMNQAWLRALHAKVRP